MLVINTRKDDSMIYDGYSDAGTTEDTGAEDSLGIALYESEWYNL